MSTEPYPPPRCTFHLRTAVEGGYRYDQISVAAPESGNLRTPYPPAVGDVVCLSLDQGAPGTYVVVARQWMHPAYGSMAWPAGQMRPSGGPMLTIVVEPADGVFRDEQP